MNSPFNLSQQIICLTGLMLFSLSTLAAKLESLLIKEVQGKISIFCTITGQYRFKAFTLIRPDRLVIDLEKTTTTINTNQIKFEHGLIKQIRKSPANQQALRIVFDISQPLRFQTKQLPTTSSKQQTLRIDLMPTTTLSIAQKNSTPIPIKHAPSKILRDVVIVLDPGHGGKDPGAIGPKRHHEKNIVLAIALKLKQQIDRQPGMKAVLTRKSDYYVGLRERLNIARRHNADIFISIHADAFINKHSNGASVFALSQTGATSEAARWLAEKENYSELGGVNLSDLDDQNGVIRTVLLDLSQTATINASLHMGKHFLHHIDKITTLHNSAVEQARFVVLKSPDIPSVLIETGFITNPQEEKNLINPSYQSKLTLAIFAGIKQYFFDYPPQGTRLEMMSNVNLHIVKKGESLPTIAKRYHIDLAVLKSKNHLINNDKIKTGQRLTIPKSVT